MKEIWKKVNGYEDIYEVSNFGNVRSLNHKVNTGIKNQNYVIMRGRNLHIYQDKPNDYKYVKLCKNNKITKKYIHRLVAIAFIPNYNDLPVVNHIDGDKENNNIDNLEWCTAQENTQHAFKTNLIPIKKGAKHHYAKKIIQYDKNGNFIKEWGSIIDVEIELGICRTAISSVCRHKPHCYTAGGFRWEYVK